MRKFTKTIDKILIVFSLIVIHNCHYIMGRPKIKAPKELQACGKCHDMTQNHSELVVDKPPGIKGIYNTIPLGDNIPFGHWNAEALDKWLKDPKAVKEDTTMTYKVTDDKTREEIIEALKGF